MYNNVTSLYYEEKSFLFNSRIYLTFLKELQTIEASAKGDRIFDFKPFLFERRSLPKRQRQCNTEVRERKTQ